MIKPIFIDSYYTLLLAYVSHPDEKYLATAVDLGQQLVKDNVQPEDIAEIHETAIKRLGQEYPDATVGETAQLVSAPLMEMLMAYGLAFRAQTESNKKLMTDLQSHRDHLEELVDERTKDIESFSYSVSHDLRAPVRAISGFSRILNEEYGHLLDQEGKRLLDVIIDNTQYMGQLIDDLLTLSHLGRKEIDIVEIHITELVKNVVAELTNEVPEREIRWKMNEIANSRGDVTMIRIVWINLLSNAVKYTRSMKKAMIEAGSRDGDNEVVYYVKDNGIGFDMEYSHKLFEVFQRLHSSKEYSGTGVGLAIVNRIIQRHGGRVWAEGKVNQGATFYFTLPKKEDER